jgi:RNA polymerase sigma-70 factor (ECF subfamily)
VRDSRRTFIDGALRENSSLSDRFDERGNWTRPPREWTLNPEDEAERKQLVAIVFELIEALPEAQATVMRLRDVEGLNTREVAEMLDLEAGHVRVLLHRARTAVRGSLETRLAEDDV